MTLKARMSRAVAAWAVRRELTWAQWAYVFRVLEELDG